MYLSTALVLGLLCSVVLAVVYRGATSLSWEMISSAPKGGYYMGKAGGVLNAIMGSLYLSLGATAVALLMSLPLVLYINLYLKPDSKFAAVVRLSLDLLWGVPSIVYGAFGFTIMMYIGLKTSMLAGVITLSVMILPIIARAMDEIMRTIPVGLVEASYSLGATRWETAFKVVVKQTLPAITTAILLGFGRAIGDAASVMFTAGYTDRLPSSLMKPVASLPLSIVYQLSAIPEVQKRAYAAAVILTIIILVNH